MCFRKITLSGSVENGFGGGETGRWHFRGYCVKGNWVRDRRQERVRKREIAQDGA